MRGQVIAAKWLSLTALDRAIMGHVQQNMAMKRAFVRSDSLGPSANIAMSCTAKIMAFVKKIISEMHDANA